MKKIKVLLFTVLCLVLVACGNESESMFNGDLSEYPTGVQDGKVNVKYYEESERIHKLIIEYTYIVERGFTDLTDYEKEEMIKESENILAKLDGLELNPKTEAEEDLYAYQYEVVENFDLMIGYGIKFLQSEEERHYELFKQHLKETASNHNVLIEIASLYDLRD